MSRVRQTSTSQKSRREQLTVGLAASRTGRIAEIVFRLLLVQACSLNRRLEAAAIAPFLGLKMNARQRLSRQSILQINSDACGNVYRNM